MTANLKTELVVLATGGVSTAVYLSNIQSVLTLATAGISFIIAVITAVRMIRKRKKKDE